MLIPPPSHMEVFIQSASFDRAVFDLFDDDMEIFSLRLKCHIILRKCIKLVLANGHISEISYNLMFLPLESKLIILFVQKKMRSR